jgi:hypothetical protein
MVVKREKSIAGSRRVDWKDAKRKTIERRDAKIKVETQIVSSRLRLCATLSTTLPTRVHFQRRRKPKAQRRLGGKNDLLVAGKCRSACTCASAGGRTNRSALAPAGQAADDCAKCRATAVRLPLPFSVRVTAEVLIRCSLPFTVIEFSRSSRMAPPLNLPKGFASTTVPRADAPAGITVLPSTVTGEASVALKD